MEKFINNYLSQNYYLNKSYIGNYGIYKIDDSRQIKVPTDGTTLINEINTIFSISIDKTFVIIYDWVIQQNPNADLNFYWKVNSELHEKMLNDFKSVNIKLGYFPKSLHMRYLSLTSKK